MAHSIKNVEIHPKSEALQDLNLTKEDFYQALEEALDCLAGRQVEKLPAPAQIPIVVRGQERQLGELARIAVSLNRGHAALRL